MKITIDNREIEVKENTTILQAAQDNDIYIPHICSHPQLTPYGGCRLCIVEVDGLRGYPTSCTTTVGDGMVIRTNTPVLSEMRQEIIQLMLSDHPSGCLICDEEEECSDNQVTIRKVGATTGCRWCPNDKDCELQKIVEYLEVKEIIFPVYYQGFRVEKEDPFFDRDYNLCIYCGRCVRICQELRKSNVITMNQRGKLTTISPPYKMTHIEGGCEFCGACVSVCPTGANFEKSRKWTGKPDTYNDSFCPLCDLNCDVQVLEKKKKIIGILPPGDPHQSGGDLCVKGRFCLSELVNCPERINLPEFKFTEGYGVITNSEAIQRVIDVLKNVDGERVAFYLSPNLSLEEIATANYFARKVLNSGNISSSVLDNNLIAMISFAEESISIEDIKSSDCIISLFVNGNYSYAPVTLEVKRAADRGVPYYQIGWFEDTTSRFSEKQIVIPPGKEKLFFRNIVKYLEKGSGASADIKELVRLIKLSPLPTFIIGHHLLDMTEGVEILQSIKRIIELTASKFFVTIPYGNISGLLSIIRAKLNSEITELCNEGKIDILYLVGDSPFQDRPPVDFIIHQSSFRPPDKLQADLILPTAIWGEISGTYVDIHKRRKKFKAVVSPGEDIMTNEEIFLKISEAISKKIMKKIPEELEIFLPNKRERKKIKLSPPNTSYPYMLIEEKTHNFYQNVSLNTVSSGMKMILPEETLIINPVDAYKLGLKNNESVIVESTNERKIYPLLIRKIILPGFLYLITTGEGLSYESNPCPVYIRRKNV